MRLYKRSHGLRQICNIAVYILHTACTIHLLNLPDKNARRDITHGVKHLEENVAAADIVLSDEDFSALDREGKKNKGG